MLYRSDTSSQYWMGAVRDGKDRNNWKWLSGEDVAVSFWNLPGGGEDCARYDGTKGWLWSDTNCNAKINYICQHRESIHGGSSLLINNFIGSRSHLTLERATTPSSLPPTSERSGRQPRNIFTIYYGPEEIFVELEKSDLLVELWDFRNTVQIWDKLVIIGRCAGLSEWCC